MCVWWSTPWLKWLANICLGGGSYVGVGWGSRIGSHPCPAANRVG
jgi:hypothetical protein